MLLSDTILFELGGYTIVNSVRRLEALRRIRRCHEDGYPLVIIVGTPAVRPTHSSNTTAELLSQFAQAAAKDPRSLRAQELHSNLTQLFCDIQPPQLPLEGIKDLLATITLQQPILPHNHEEWCDRVIAIGPVVGAMAIAAHLQSLKTCLVRTTHHDTGLRTASKHAVTAPHVRSGRIQSPRLQKHLEELCRSGLIPVITGGVGIDFQSERPTVISRNELRPTTMAISSMLATTRSYVVA